MSSSSQRKISSSFSRGKSKHLETAGACDGDEKRSKSDSVSVSDESTCVSQPLELASSEAPESDESDSETVYDQAPIKTTDSRTNFTPCYTYAWWSTYRFIGDGKKIGEGGGA